jgi:hypothetical protein
MRIAGELAGLGFGDNPESVVVRVKLAVLDQIGIRLRGASLGHVSVWLELARALGSRWCIAGSAWRLRMPPTSVVIYARAGT